MKTQSSPESGYFNPRVFVVFVLWVCGAWLAAISFAPPAQAWSVKQGGSPGAVVWELDFSQPIIAMGYNYPGSADFTIHRHPHIGMSPNGGQRQYASVTMRVYWYCAAGKWCQFDQKTSYTDWIPYGSYFVMTNCPRVTSIPTTYNYHWTVIMTIEWYNSNYQLVAWEHFYPDRTGTTKFNWCDRCTEPYGWQWWGNADLAIHMYAVGKHAGAPWGNSYAYNLNTPNGNIYCLRGGP
jgi:hypothetical protein